MACIKKEGNAFENLTGYNTFIKDRDLNSQYFKVSKFSETFSAGKNLFLLEGSECLKESTEIKMEIVDSEGGTLYIEPGRGIPDYYEGNSIVLSSHVYDDTPVGPAKITILGELKDYYDDDGIKQPIPDDWKNAYNVKWEKEFFINKNMKNSTPVIFYKRPVIEIEEVASPILEQNIPSITQTGKVIGLAENPPLGTEFATWRAGVLYRLELSSGSNFNSNMDENIIKLPSINYQATVKEVINKNTLLVDTPILDSDGKITKLDSEDYTITFEDFSNRTTVESSVTGSYGRIIIKDIETFTGNVDKVKIYKKSRSDVGDYKFADEVKIVAGELLRDDLNPMSDLDGGFGKLAPGNVTNYWETSSVSISGSESSISFDDDLLFESIKFNIPSSSFQGEPLEFITQNVFEVYNGVDYELGFRTLVSGAFEDTIIGETTVISESYVRTFWYKYDPSKLRISSPTYLSASSYTELEAPNSSSIDITKPLIFDSSRVEFYDTPQNNTGSTYTSIPSGFTNSGNSSNTLTFDTTSGDWGTTSRIQTEASDNAKVIALSGSLSGNFNVIVWADSDASSLPVGGSPDSITSYIETFTSSSTTIAAVSLRNVDTNAKLYYHHSNTSLDELSSFRNSIEYPLESVDTSDYSNPQSWHTSSTGSQAIIPYSGSGYHYLHIDYRTLREVEFLNADLINVKRLDSLNGDILYGSSYEIHSINFETGDIEFGHDAVDGTLSGTLSLVNGQAVITIGSDTKTGYIVELDFNNGFIVFVGELDFTELEPQIRSYDLFDIFDLSGSNWVTTGSTDLVVPRVPPQGGDYLYESSGYPFRTKEFSDRNFLTTEFTSPSSSDDNFSNPLEIPYVFRNDNDKIENVYVEESDQIYVASSVSSSADINNTNYVYDQKIHHTGWYSTGSFSGSVYVDESQDASTQLNSLSTYNSRITSLNSISSSQGNFNLVVVTDSGSVELPTSTGSFQFQIENYQSGSNLRTAMALRNVEKDALLYYNNSSTSQSVLESYSGSTNIVLDDIDSSDFTYSPVWFLSTGSQVIFDSNISGHHFIYVDYRTNRATEPLNANLNEVTAISQIGTTDFNSLKAREIFPFSGSKEVTGSVTSTTVYSSQVPVYAGSGLYQPSDYPFVTDTSVNGAFISDDLNPTTDLTIPDAVNGLQIPYSFEVTSGKIENVFVKSFDNIYTASSTNGTGTTSFNTPPIFISQSLKAPDTIVPKKLTAFITGAYYSGSTSTLLPFKEEMGTFIADSSYATRKEINNLFTMPYSGSARLGFDVTGDGWQVSKISLKPTQDESFSPKLFKTLDEQERNLPIETFDYRFELYDVNNNYIPVDIQQSKEFSGGNKVSTELVKIFQFESDAPAFRFFTGSLANPPSQQVKFNFSKTAALTGSINFASAAFDDNGNYIEPSSYTGNYPGGLTNITNKSALLSVANFSGSDASFSVSSIVYTASVEDFDEFETIYRLEDGLPAADLVVTNDRSIITFKQNDGTIDPLSQVSTIRVKRKNLESNSVSISANSASVVGNAPPLILVNDDSTSGVATFAVSGSSLDLTSGSVEYSFSSSDEFGLQVDNSTIITPIAFLGGIVLYLSNERGVLPAFASGIIPSSSYEFTSGSTKLYIDGDEISFNNSGTPNTYRITGVTGSGITPNEVAPTTNNYGGLPGTMGAASSSLAINVSYTDFIGRVYEFGRVANFNTIQEGADGQPGLAGANGPGLVFTGDYDNTRDYTVTTGSLSRKDSVLYNDTFYLAISSSGAGTSNGLQHPSSSTEYWEELGSGSNFVAAELAIFAESYVQNTINVGTNNSGGTSASNITIYGSGSAPYISVGQGSSTGTQGYDVGDGIFLGINGNTGTASLSLESGLGNDQLLWDGSTLTIQGSIEFSNTPGAINDTLQSASLAALNAVLSGSESANSVSSSLSSSLSETDLLVLQTSASNAQVNSDLSDVISGTTALENGSGATFIDNGIIYSPNIGGTNGYFSNAFRVGENGITLDGTNSRIYVGNGTYGNSNTPFYFASGSSNVFSLGDKLSWDGSTLSLEGAINITSGTTKNKLDDIESDTTSSLLLSNNASSSAAEASASAAEAKSTADGINANTGSLVNHTSYAFGEHNSAFALANATAAEGLNLNSDFLGYHDGSDFKSYMDNSGSFFLGGDDGALIWNGSELRISGSIEAFNGSFSGNVTASTLTVGEGTIANFRIQENSLSSSNFEIKTTDSGSINFMDAGSPVVKIKNFGGLTQNVTTSSPTVSGTIASSNSVSDTQTTRTGYLNYTDTTQTNTNDTSLPGFSVGSDLDGLDATLSVTFTGGNSGTHLESSTNLSNVSGTTMMFHNIEATFGVELLKDGTVVDTKTEFIRASDDSDRTLSATGTFTKSFSIVLDGGSSYTVRSFVRQKSAYAFGSNQQQLLIELDTEFYPPDVSSTPTLTIHGGGGNAFTEITRGGFQVVSNATKAVIMPTDTTQPQLVVSGSLEATGNIVAFASSDERLKENIKPIPWAVDKVSKLEGVTFDWREGYDDIHRMKGHDVGVIAQNVKDIVPEVVSEMMGGYLGVKYEKLTPLLIEAIKELSQKVDELEKEIKRLK